MARRNMKRLNFINGSLLGRKRVVTEQIHLEETEEQGQSEVDVININMLPETETVCDREEVIRDCQELFDKFAGEAHDLMADFHERYLLWAFSDMLPPQMKALEASQPWIIYWIANSLKVMCPGSLTTDTQRRICQKLLKIAEPDGLFAGGQGQLPNLLCTYASIAALALCDNVDDCWEQIDRKAIYNWLMKLKTPDGGFRTCLEVGECDTRGIYCALAVAQMLQIMTSELCQNVKFFLIRCQTYEGGFGACPQGDEAHGGYTFCAVASLAILNEIPVMNIEQLMEWCSARQYNEEKGLSGRSNKLVDGCYSYWIGATSAILEAHGYGDCINKPQLREYILKCCQSSGRPGLRDKPGKSPDFYHTNYIALGLSITEYSFEAKKGPDALVNSSRILRTPETDLQPINPVFGLPSKDLADIIIFNKDRL
ncbi:LAMI_0E01992g1_1 [Lachancea mirantina]|uniref:Protein farnesyltransferase subunit beta n=1 Tax=Lachancea mirantina TaxID=1230905 RepID=A0A1G4JJC5_9SACH|nr:LAMI_0E01992g1_1 [Lachancea mirantina]